MNIAVSGPGGDALSRLADELAAARRELTGANAALAAVHRVVQEQKQALEQTVAERTRSAARAAAAGGARTTFLASMSHEIRTPMNGVLGLLELVEQEPLSPSQRANLHLAQVSGRSLLKIVDDVLDLSRLEAGRLQLHPAPASIRAVMRGACDLHGPQAVRKGIALTVGCDDEVSRFLEIDALRLTQILDNLLGNALKFTEAGWVEVQVHFQGRLDGMETLRICVDDTGIGIPADRMALLFEPFVQGDATTAERHGGSGLGLAVCRQLVGLMGGTVQLHSRPGGGTAAIVDLAFPVSTTAVDELPIATASHPVPAGKARRTTGNGRILVVDDHPVNRSVLCRLLASLGHDTHAAENGQEGYDAWRGGGYVLVLADCNMPVMDGYEMTRRIREREKEAGGLRTPVIACTAKAMASEEDRCQEAGMDECMIKPVTLAQLTALVSRWLPA